MARRSERRVTFLTLMEKHSSSALGPGGLRIRNVLMTGDGAFFLDHRTIDLCHDKAFRLMLMNNLVIE